MRFKLESIIFPQVNYVAKPEFYKEYEAGNTIDIKSTMIINTRNIEDELYEVVEIVKAENEIKSLVLQVVSVGVFRFDNVDIEKIDYALNVNCASILFPYIREKVSSLTGASGITPIYLEPFNFIERYKKIKVQEDNSGKGDQ